MLVLSWNVFSRTGNIETYLLHKELEREKETEEIAAVQLDDRSDPTFF